MSTYVIGDVHGAGQELQALLKKINPTPSDEVILVGDVFDRGFYGHLVWELIQQYKMPVIMGNHENKMRKFLHKERDEVPLHYLWAFINLFETTKVISQSDFLKWLDELPLLLERSDAIIAHAGVNVLNPHEMNEGCNVYGNISPYDRRKKNWWEAYDGNALVVWGHLIPADHQPMYGKNSRGNVNSVCIDTGAVHGGNLTAYCIETKEIIQHQSGIDHYRKMKKLVKQEPPRFQPDY